MSRRLWPLGGILTCLVVFGLVILTFPGLTISTRQIQLAFSLRSHLAADYGSDTPQSRYQSLRLSIIDEILADLSPGDDSVLPNTSHLQAMLDTPVPTATERRIALLIRTPVSETPTPLSELPPGASPSPTTTQMVGATQIPTSVATASATASPGQPTASATQIIPTVSASSTQPEQNTPTATNPLPTNSSPSDPGEDNPLPDDPGPGNDPTPPSIFTLTPFITPNSNPTPIAGWLDGWAYRKLLRVSSSRVTTNLANFPLLVQLASDPHLAAFAQDDGNDLRFTNLAGEALDYEIEAFQASIGRLTAWVRIPQLDANRDTQLYLYFGNPSAVNQEDASRVWDSDFRAVWHLADNPARSQPACAGRPICDSSGRANHGFIRGGMNADDRVAGQLGGALAFDGDDDAIEMSDSSSLDVPASSDLTIEAWIYRASGNSHDVILAKSSGSALQSQAGYALFVHQDSNTLVFSVSDGRNAFEVMGKTALSPGWHHVAAVFDRDDPSKTTLYLDGTDDKGETSGQHAAVRNLSNNAPFRIGQDGQGENEFDGRIDGVRISAPARSAAWIRTSYRNQSNPSEFFQLGALETIP